MALLSTNLKIKQSGRNPNRQDTTAQLPEFVNWSGECIGVVAVRLSCLGHICSLRAFLTFGDLKLHLVPLLQAFVSLGTDRAVVNEDVRPIRAPDEAVSLGIIEPLDGSLQTFHVSPLFPHVLNGGKDVPAVVRMHFGTRKISCQVTRS